MTVDAYLNPDFTWDKKLIFFLMAFVMVIMCISMILGGVGLSVSGMRGKKRKRELYDRANNRVQRFYEMVISATSVMSFSCAYIICNHIYSLIQAGVSSEEYARFGAFVNVWENGKDFVLLVLICLSCVLNSILDRLIIPLKRINREEKATVRMLAMFYVIFILLWLNVIGDESEYSPVMLYYLGLMVGRFVYFDASFLDFIHALQNVIRNIYLLILGLLITGMLCYVGFSNGYLLERNYYLIGAFYTHLFMLAAVFVLHHSRLISLIIRKPSGYVEAYESEDVKNETDLENDLNGYDEYEGYEEYEEYEEGEYEEDGYEGYEDYGDYEDEDNDDYDGYDE